MKFLIPLFFVLFSLTLNAQSDRLVDSVGKLKYQYNRMITTDVDNPGMAIVTLVFINGNTQTAITYRQEKLNSTLVWVNTDKGLLNKETILEGITANLAPKETIVWKFSVSNKPRNKNGTVDIEKAALLIMNDQFEVEKILFPNSTHRL